MDGERAIHFRGEYRYGTDMTPRAGFSDYDEDSERLVWLRRGSPDAVRFFCDDIDHQLGPGVAIVAVPSHSPTRGPNVGIGKLAEALATGGRVNLGVHLRRHQKVPSLTEKHQRETELHLESITAAKGVFEGREILLLDDLACTGNSLRACGKLLVHAGASRVGFLVLQHIPEPGRRAAMKETRRYLPRSSKPETPVRKTYPPRASRVSCANPGPAAPRAGVSQVGPDEQTITDSILRASELLAALQGGGITPGRAVADLRALEEILAAQSGRQSHLSERQFAELKRLVQALRTALSPVHQPTRNSRTQSSSGATAASTNLWNTYGEFESWGLRRRRS